MRLEISKAYGEDAEAARESFLLSVCACNARDSFQHAEALADEYFQIYSGASAHWQEMVRILREDNSGGNDLDTYIIDVRIAQMTDGRKVFIGKNGYCGLVPDHTEPGDLTCVLFCCNVPVVLRKVAGHHVFIGQCYVRGLMQGEAIESFD